MAIAYLGIGSNLGERESNCINALERLTTKGIEIIAKSSLYETKPWGMKDQPDFINMCAKAETALCPEDLLAALKGTEKEMGREEGDRWGPRLIDLDILFYDDKIVRTPDLSIPHPLIEQRDFVLIPLCEIAPDLVHPVSRKTIRELTEQLKGDQPC